MKSGVGPRVPGVPECGRNPSKRIPTCPRYPWAKDKISITWLTSGLVHLLLEWMYNATSKTMTIYVFIEHTRAFTLQIATDIRSSAITWSSLTSTQRIEKGGSRWAKPRSGGFEQEVTNFRKSPCDDNETRLSLFRVNKEGRGIKEIRITAPIFDSVPFHLGSSPHRGSPTAIEPRDDFRGIHRNTEYVFCEKEKAILKV